MISSLYECASYYPYSTFQGLLNIVFPNTGCIAMYRNAIKWSFSVITWIKKSYHTKVNLPENNDLMCILNHIEIDPTKEYPQFPLAFQSKKHKTNKRILCGLKWKGQVKRVLTYSCSCKLFPFLLRLCSLTIPESSCVDTKNHVITHNNSDLRLDFCNGTTLHRANLEVDRHIPDKFLSLFVAMWTGIRIVAEVNE